MSLSGTLRPLLLLGIPLLVLVVVVITPNPDKRVEVIIPGDFKPPRFDHQNFNLGDFNFSIWRNGTTSAPFHGIKFEFEFLIRPGQAIPMAKATFVLSSATGAVKRKAVHDIKFVVKNETVAQAEITDVFGSDYRIRVNPPIPRGEYLIDVTVQMGDEHVTFPPMAHEISTGRENQGG